MSKDKEILNRFGANLAESMGAGRTPIPGGATAAATSGRHDGVNRLRSAAEIALDRIVPDPNQPRTEFDPEALARLAASLTAHGQLQPISVRWSEAEGRYLIVAGERRWRAAALAGRTSVAAVILDGQPSDSQILEMQLVENCLREDLQPVEQARAFKALMDRNGWTAARLAEALQVTGSTVSRALALLDLPCTVQEAVEAGSLAPSVAYELSKIDDPVALAEVASRVVAEDLSRAETIEAVKQVARRPTRGEGKGRAPGKPRKVTSRVLRGPDGYRVTIERGRGIEAESVADVLRQVADQVEAEQRGRGEEAA